MCIKIAWDFQPFTQIKSLPYLLSTGASWLIYSFVTDQKEPFIITRPYIVDMFVFSHPNLINGMLAEELWSIAKVVSNLSIFKSDSCNLLSV